MKVIGKIHEILRRRIDKDNPESDYYEIYPITVVDSVYLSEDRDQTLGEYLKELETSYDTFLDSISFPVTSVQVYNGKQYGPIKLGNVKLTAKDFGLDKVDNTPDNQKPISEPQKSYLTEYINTINKELGSTLANIDNWNNHLKDYNNPHRVTWEQVAPGTTVDPTNLVDQSKLEELIKNHNESTDLSSLHPTILSQINNMKAQLTEIENIIKNMDVNISGNLTTIVSGILEEHNMDETAHPFILSKLQQLSTDITTAITQYSGLTGVEMISNKVNEINYSQLDATPSTDTTSPFATQYPSVLALKSFLEHLNITSFTDVKYFPTATTPQIDSLKDSGRSGIVFVDTLDAVKGTHIFIYADGEYLVKYSIPSPTQNFEVVHLSKVPSLQEARNQYGSRHVLMLCDRSTAPSVTIGGVTKYKQSICIYIDQYIQEFILDREFYQGEDHVFEVLYTDSNNSFNYETGFLSGRGILFTSDLYEVSSTGDVGVRTGRPGVILYQKGQTPEYRSIPLGGNTRNFIMKEFATQPTQEQVTKTIFPTDGTGIVYVNNMYTATSGTPGFEIWFQGEKKFSKALQTLSQEHFEHTLTGNGSAVSKTFNLSHSYDRNSLKAIAVVAGFNTNNVTTGNLTVTATVTNITANSVTVSFTVTNGVWAKFIVSVVGVNS